MYGRRRSRRLAFVAGIAVLASVLTACGSSSASSGGSDVQKAYDDFVKAGIPGLPQSLLEQAKTEGAVTLYSLTVMDAAVADFKKLFPFIKVNYVAISGAQLNARIAAERNAGKDTQDVVATDEATIRKFVASNDCESYTPTSDAAFPANDKVAGKAYRWGSAEVGIAYNTSALSAEDQAALKTVTWQTLVDQRWSGKKFGWIDFNAGFSAVLPNYYFYTEYGPDFFAKHVAVAGKPHIYGGTAPLTQALVQGEIDMSGPITMLPPYTSWSQGAPVAWTVPTPVLATNSMGCILSKAPHPAAAKVLWEYLLSERGQEKLAPGGNLSSRQGFDLTKALPSKLTSEPWFTAPEISTAYEYLPADVTAKSKPAGAAWESVMAGN
jgi:iron(III) transport system substrate-binding protein